MSRFALQTGIVASIAALALLLAISVQPGSAAAKGPQFTTQTGTASGEPRHKQPGDGGRGFVDPFDEDLVGLIFAALD